MGEAIVFSVTTAVRILVEVEAEYLRINLRSSIKLSRGCQMITACCHQETVAWWSRRPTNRKISCASSTLPIHRLTFAN